MKIANTEIAVDRALIEKLAGPLAKLMTEQGGTPVTEKELVALMLDPNTEVEFPGIQIRQQASVVVVRRVRVVVVSQRAGGNEFVTLIDDGGK